MPPTSHNSLSSKVKNLERRLREAGSALVAFSGGLDSTFLLYMAKCALGTQAAACTVVSDFVPERERRAARIIAEELGVRRFVIEVDTLSDAELAHNPQNRCYLCKRFVYTKALEIARREELHVLMDGTSLSDSGEHRPGRKAVQELGVHTPLKDAGLTREDIRTLSRQAGLKTWDKPAATCLATRFPYGTQLTREQLARVDRAEEQLLAMGFRSVRVRVHGDTARIEVPYDDIPKLAGDPFRTDLLTRLQPLEFRYVTLDLEGYRSGSMDLP